MPRPDLTTHFIPHDSIGATLKFDRGRQGRKGPHQSRDKNEGMYRSGGGEGRASFVTSSLGFNQGEDSRWDDQNEKLSLIHHPTAFLG